MPTAEIKEDVEIKRFLEGHNPKQDVIAVEVPFNSNQAHVFSQYSDSNEKRMEQITFKPFIYIKDFKRLGVKFYDDDKTELGKAMRKLCINVRPLRAKDDNGAIVERLDNGYKYLVETTHSTGYQAIQNFFKNGGVDIWRKSSRKMSFILRKPGPQQRTDGLYTLLEQDGKTYFLYNNVLEQYEIHVPAFYVSRYTERDENGDGFLRLKGDKKDLIQGIDFDVHYYEPKDKYVLTLKTQNEVEKAKLALKLKEAEDALEAEYASKEEEGTDFEAENDDDPERIEAAIEKSVGFFKIDDHSYQENFEHPKVIAWIRAAYPDVESFWWSDYADEALKALKAEKTWSKEDTAERKTLQKERATYDKTKAKAERAKTTYQKRRAKEQEEKEAKLAKLVDKFNDTRHTYNKVSLAYVETNSPLFFTMKREEQFMVSTGIRLFKGIEKYADIHKCIYDIETTGLNPEVDRVFMIGIKDNRGYQKVLVVKKPADDDEERLILGQFFLVLNHINASIVYGYNSENFDWDFVLRRAEILGLDFGHMPEGVRLGKGLARKPGRTIKFGGETETYTQTILQGRTVLDIYHAVRRTMALNSDIQLGNLKYICKYESIAKPNRIYVPGNKIYAIWQENKYYLVNKDTGEYEALTSSWQSEESAQIYLHQYIATKLAEGKPAEYNIQRGKEIVEQYLIDDLWETEQVDARYNEDKFLVGKLLGTSFLRTCTMGGASQWNLIMAAWSYEQNLAIPYTLQAKTFTGGLSRTFMLGKFTNVYKFDFSGLYPSLQLEHDIFPRHDVTNVLKRLLLYFKTTRDHFKYLAGDNSPLPKDERKPYKAKQLPLKILNNSNFGANGSAYFNWADFTCAERITCMGRLYLRNMVQFFQVYGCKATVVDTDGVNMEVPFMMAVDIDGNHLEKSIPTISLRYTYEGKEYKGADAIVAKYNAEVLASPYMKLDNDGMWPSAMNCSRKNYANMEAPDTEKGETEGKIKYVGNTLKQKTMPAYIAEFMKTGIGYLLRDDGKGFVEYYYDYLTKIYTMQMPLRKIANKAKIKESIEDYLNRGADKNGKRLPQKAHMELIIQSGKKVNLGDVVYFVSTGTKKSHSYTSRDKVTKELRAYLITEEEFEAEPDKLSSYNVERYIAAFNKRISALLVVFKPEVRTTLMQVNPTKRNLYTEKGMELISLDNPRAEDDINNFFTLEDSEVDFWNRTGYDPRKVLPEFTTRKTFDGHEFQDTLAKCRKQLEAQGFDLKAYYDHYKNGDLVMGFERKHFLVSKETENKIPVSPSLFPYFEDEFKPFFDSSVYKKVMDLRNLLHNGYAIHKTKEYSISKVENGELVEIKRF